MELLRILRLKSDLFRALLRGRSVTYGREHLVRPILKTADPGDLLIQTFVRAGHVALLGVLSLQDAVHVLELDWNAIAGRPRRLAIDRSLSQSCRLLRVNGSLSIRFILILLLHDRMLMHHD